MREQWNYDMDMIDFGLRRKNLDVWEFLPLCNKAKVEHIFQLCPIVWHILSDGKDFSVYPFSN